MSQVLYNAFVANVRERMAMQGLSQADLAKRLKVTPSYISQILSGHRRPGLDALEAFGRVLDTEPSELIQKKCYKSA